MSDHVLCPHCGKKNGDLWDHDWGSREELETWCDSCDQPIVIHRVVSVEYSVSVPKSALPDDETLGRAHLYDLRKATTMSVFWSLVNRADKRVLHLGTGRWEVALSSEENDWFNVPVRPASEIRQRLELYFANCDEARLGKWALQIASLMNSKPTVLINDSFESQERDIAGYRSVGILSRRG